jgi:ribosomal protein L3 glutamine methyltransferase
VAQSAQPRALAPSADSHDALAPVRSVHDLISLGVSRLIGADLAFGHGTDNALDEATYLVLHALDLPVAQASSHLQKRVNARQVRAALELLERRVRDRCPAAYLTREAWLGPHRFYVDERVIVPRSYLAEWIRQELGVWIPQPQRVENVLELCTGSGCLAILLAKALPRAQIDATDISKPALAVARRNLARYRLTKRIRLVESDLFKSLGRKRYDLIIANPPYVTARAMARLPQEYRHEPPLALSGGHDGMDFLRRILAQAPSHLRRHGALVMEIGRARRRVERAFPRTAFTWLETSAGDDAIFLLQRDEIPQLAILAGLA